MANDLENRASRRAFLGAAAGTAATAAFVGMPSVFNGNSGRCLAQPAGKVRIRKDVATLNGGSPDIVALKTAVVKMKALPAADKRHWLAQAQIHGSLGGGFGKCQHGSWYFLPWHRSYLYHFEEVVRGMSGNDDFALPYWDWSTNFTLPALFWVQGDPLNNVREPGVGNVGRRPGMNAATAMSQENIDGFVSQTVISRILASDDFETFGGPAVANLGDRASAGDLEGTPHNFVHRWVSGDMGAGGSPYDPIFWLHHCNVDRLWNEWTIKHPKSTPAAKNWLNAAFTDFCDRNGNATTMTVAQTLNTAAIGYVYDKRPDPAGTLVEAAALIEPPVAALTSTAKTFALAGGAGAFNLKTTAAQAAAITAIAEARAGQTQTARVRLTGVKIPKNQDVAMQVHINCERVSADLPVTAPSYVTSVTFFGSHDAGHDGHAGGGDAGTTSFLLNVDRVFTRLYADRPFPADEPIKVVLIAKPLFPSAENPWKGEVQELKPEQVSFEVVSRT